MYPILKAKLPKRTAKARLHSLIFFRDKKKQYRWRLVSPNGKIVATSGGDGYTRLGWAKKGAESAMKGFSNHVVYQ